MAMIPPTPAPNAISRPAAAGAVPPINPMVALDAGIAQADDEALAKLGVDPAKERIERADVSRWFSTYNETRKFDEHARRQYALDRRYARGDSGFLVDANIIGTNIDILEAFLYARNPEFSVTPGRSMKPPSADALRDAIEDQLEADGEFETTGMLARQAALAAGLPPDQAEAAAQQAQLNLVQSRVQAELYQLRKRYARRQRDIKAFAETCEMIGTRMWYDAKLKRRGIRMVRSGLTVALGVLKASWQERTEISPETTVAINDLQGNLQRARALKQQIEQGNSSGVTTATYGNAPVQQDATVAYGPTDDTDANIAELERQLQALQANAERVVERGYVIDFLDPECFVVAPGYAISEHLDAPWNANHDYIPFEDALAQFGPYLKQKYPNCSPEDILGQATRWAPRKPETVQSKSWGEAVANQTLTADDGDQFVTSSSNPDAGSGTVQRFVKVVEFWSRDSNSVLTGIDGVQCWVKPAWNPPPTTRFYPYFTWTTSEVDGQRHPQSLVTRTAKLVDEYNRIGSAETEHRRRILPKMAFNAGAIPPKEAKKLANASIGELVALNLTEAGAALPNVLYPVQYPEMDPAVYDRTRITNEIERIWGIQEALSGSVDAEKTATEAEIQQSGFNARSSSRRDSIDATFSDLAQYTIEIARQYVTEEDAIEIVGPDAFWPKYGGPDDVVYSVNIEVRAGSSGKPNTSRERESWGILLPQLSAGIEKIGALRGAAPDAIADSLEELLKITAERSGERIDIEGLIPRSDGGMGAAGMLGPQMPGGPQPGGPQPGGGPAVPGAAADVPVGPDPSADPLSPSQQPATFA